MNRLHRVHMFRCAGLLTLLSVFIPGRADSQNFTASNRQLVIAAEAAREASAKFWTGKSLPGEWSAPCLIEVTRLADPAGGSTRFQFASGEVFNWNMTVYGAQQSLLADVIPHEVDHMVRATLLRTPITRWLDEGCATLFESAATKHRLRQHAQRVDISQLDISWLTSDDYPTSTRDMTHLYVCGFAFVEYLLTLRTPAALLELQGAKPDLPTAFERLYNFPLSQLPARWQASQQNPASGNALPTNSTRPVLTIWTASWCPPCRQLQLDLQNDDPFRRLLTSAFDIRFIDVDEHAALASARGVQRLPTFETSTRRWNGYTDQESLLRQLGLPRPTPPKSPAHQPDPEELNPPIPKATADPLPLSLESSPSVPIVIAASTNTSTASNTGSTSSPWMRLLPAISSLLPLASLLGGTAVTGGLGGVGISLLVSWLRRRRRLQSSPTIRTAEGGELDFQLPFPRQLDEARELLQLRQSEGRVAVLDALRGMFLDDELERLQQSSTPDQQVIAGQLRSAIDLRIDEVAPLSTTLSN